MKRETTNVLIAFVLGAVAGGAAALLLAPVSGEEARMKIKEGFKKANEFAEIQKEAFKEAYTEGKHAYQRIVKKKDEPSVEG